MPKQNIKTFLGAKLPSKRLIFAIPITFIICTWLIYTTASNRLLRPVKISSISQKAKVAGEQEIKTENDSLSIAVANRPLFMVFSSALIDYDAEAEYGTDRANRSLRLELINTSKEVDNFNPSLENIYTISNSDIFIYNSEIDTWAYEAISGENQLFNTWEALNPKPLSPSFWLSPKQIKELIPAFESKFINQTDAQKKLTEKNINPEFLLSIDKINLKYEEVLTTCEETDILFSDSTLRGLAADYGLVNNNFSININSDISNQEAVPGVVDMQTQPEIEMTLEEILESNLETIAKVAKCKI